MRMKELRQNARAANPPYLSLAEGA